jgi:hypothetical protein
MTIPSSPIKVICLGRPEIDTLGSRSLHPLLADYSNQKATEPKDRIFGRLSIACAESGTFPEYEIDYNPDPEDIVKSMIRSYGSHNEYDEYLEFSMREALRLDNQGGSHYSGIFR